MATKALLEVARRIRARLKPPPRLTVSEWAERYRQLSPEASAEPGKWYNARAPHLVAPMDALSPSDPCQRVNLKFCSQSGKTEVILNFLGYIMDVDPGPVLCIQPNQKPMGEAFSKDRIAPMLRDTPTLKEAVAAPRSRDSANTLFHKSFPGGHLTVGGANSPAGLASRPIRYLLNDELDRWEVTKEGHALLLARKRTTTFFNRKELNVSSPTYDEVGISAEYDESDQQFERHLVCPDCGESQFPQLRHFRWPKDEPQKAVYVCEHCGVTHGLEQEDRLKLTGKWVQVKDTGDYSKGFWMNQWASPFATWHQTIKEFLAAKDQPERLQTVVNTAFAEGWQEDGETVDENSLLERREPYNKSELPEGVLVLVAAVDVQDDRVEAEVVGFGLGEESWSIEYRVIYGDPSKKNVWDDLDRFLLGTYPHPSGTKLHIAASAIDSGGHHTTDVYEFCKTRQSRRVFCIKGVGGEGKPIVSAPSKKRYGKYKRPVPVFNVGSDAAKRLVYANLRVEKPGPGYCHFPTDYTAEYFEQLTAEKLVTRFHKGFPRKEWIKTRPRNEALDIRAYCLAALRLLNPAFDLIAAQMQQEEQKPVVQKKRPVTRPRQRGNFVSNWR